MAKSRRRIFQLRAVLSSNHNGIETGLTQIHEMPRKSDQFGARESADDA
jgi:hypothetical protein